MTDRQDHRNETPRRRAGGLAAAGLVVGVAGLLACVAGQPARRLAVDTGERLRAGLEAQDVYPVSNTPVSREGRFGPSAGQAIRPRELSTLRTPVAALRQFVRGDQGAEVRTQALLARRERRVFEGVPPAMGHSAGFGEGSRSCVDCHRDGMAIGPRIAHPMSHVELSNCTQCHLETEHVEFGTRHDPPANAFEGRGSRVPPRIPHTTSLRGDCRTCHAAPTHDLLPREAPDRRGPRWSDTPPPMPHEALAEGTRDCVRCHAQGEPVVEVLRHPLGRAVFEDCLACHRDQHHASFGGDGRDEGGEGDRANGGGGAPHPDDWSRLACLACHGNFMEPDPAGRAMSPPAISHGTLLRGRCLSCHGEFGHPGLQIDHPFRGQCLQCHLPVAESSEPGLR